MQRIAGRHTREVQFQSLETASLSLNGMDLGDDDNLPVLEVMRNSSKSYHELGLLEISRDDKPSVSTLHVDSEFLDIDGKECFLGT
jgi:hypothetical protein